MSSLIVTIALAALAAAAGNPVADEQRTSTRPTPAALSVSSVARSGWDIVTATRIAPLAAQRATAVLNRIRRAHHSAPRIRVLARRSPTERPASFLMQNTPVGWATHWHAREYRYSGAG